MSNPDIEKSNRILEQVQAEFYRARDKHTTPMRSVHEGYAILLEEVDELWAACKLQDVNKQHLRAEAIQVAAMAVRFIFDLT